MQMISLDPYLTWISRLEGDWAPGTRAHRDAFCHMLLDTYNPYKPAVIDWPALSETELARISALPFWDTAVAIEGRAALRMEWQAGNIDDPLIGEALTLNAAEERRHKEVLHNMLARCGIETGPEPRYLPPLDPEFGFLRTGYGECINSFFAFGLFELARQSGFFPPALVDTFEPIVQEEARHILFFANYLAYRRASLPGWRYLMFQVKSAATVLDQLLARLDMAIAAWRRKRTPVVQSSFLAKGATAMVGRFDGWAFLALCLRENDRRMAGYDQRLSRPRLVPQVAHVMLSLFGGRARKDGEAS